MIAEKFVDLYARNSGIRDKIVAERDVVLTYALRAMHDAALLNQPGVQGRHSTAQARLRIDGPVLGGSRLHVRLRAQAR